MASESEEYEYAYSDDDDDDDEAAQDDEYPEDNAGDEEVSMDWSTSQSPAENPNAAPMNFGGGECVFVSVCDCVCRAVLLCN